MTPDEARAEGDRFMTAQMTFTGTRREETINKAQAVYQSGFAQPQLTPRKREPDTYCFRCGKPVPGGIFITNTRYKGRHVSWVDATDMPSRNPVDGSTVPPHPCIRAGQLELAL